MVASQRMPHIATALLTVAFVARTTLAAPQDVDPCARPESIALQTLIVLEGTRIDAHGEFIGMFRVENLGQQAIELPARRVATGFAIGRPETSIEYRAPTGEWLRMPKIPGSFAYKLEALRVGPHQKAKFVTELMSQSAADSGPQAFRLLIGANTANMCFVSAPFERQPAPARVTGFATPAK